MLFRMYFWVFAFLHHFSLLSLVVKMMRKHHRKTRKIYAKTRKHACHLVPRAKTRMPKINTQWHLNIRFGAKNLLRLFLVLNYGPFLNYVMQSRRKRGPYVAACHENRAKNRYWEGRKGGQNLIP